MINHLLVASTTLQTIQNATQEDQSLQELQQYIIQGWPDTKYGLPSYITPYYDIRDELTVQQEMVLKGNTLVVPQAARKFALGRIHSSHRVAVKRRLQTTQTATADYGMGTLAVSKTCAHSYKHTFTC